MLIKAGVAGGTGQRAVGLGKTHEGLYLNYIEAAIDACPMRRLLLEL